MKTDNINSIDRVNISGANNTASHVVTFYNYRFITQVQSASTVREKNNHNTHRHITFDEFVRLGLSTEYTESAEPTELPVSADQ